MQGRERCGRGGRVRGYGSRGSIIGFLRSRPPPTAPLPPHLPQGLTTQVDDLPALTRGSLLGEQDEDGIIPARPTILSLYNHLLHGGGRQAKRARMPRTTAGPDPATTTAGAAAMTWEAVLQRASVNLTAAGAATTPRHATLDGGALTTEQRAMAAVGASTVAGNATSGAERAVFHVGHAKSEEL